MLVLAADPNIPPDAEDDLCWPKSPPDGALDWPEVLPNNPPPVPVAPEAAGFCPNKPPLGWDEAVVLALEFAPNKPPDWVLELELPNNPPPVEFVFVFVVLLELFPNNPPPVELVLAPNAGAGWLAPNIPDPCDWVPEFPPMLNMLLLVENFFARLVMI